MFYSTSFQPYLLLFLLILILNQSINLFICFVLQNEKYTNICEKKFSKAQEGSEMTIRSSSQLPPNSGTKKKKKHSSTLTKTQYI